MKIFILVHLFLLSIFSKANADCFNKKDEMGFYWARGEVRRQAGGWIWFLGKGRAKYQQDSEDLAIGRALERYKEECPRINTRVKIYERCTQKSDQSFESFVRVSIKSKFCKNKNLELNVKLQTKHKQYLEYVKAQSSRLRRKMRPLQSFIKNTENEVFKKQTLAQINYLNRKIDNLLGKNNYLVSFFDDNAESFITPKNFSLADYITKIYVEDRLPLTKIMNISKRACKKNTPLACYVYVKAKVLNAKKDIKVLSVGDLKTLEKSCTDGYGPSCIFIGRFLDNFKSVISRKKIISELDKYCKLHHAVENIENRNDDPCYALALIFRDNPDKRFEYEKISCGKINTGNYYIAGNICDAYGFNYYIGKDHEALGGLARKKDSHKKAVELYKISCNTLGEKCDMYRELSSKMCIWDYCDI